MKHDISVILTAHSESVVSGRTLSTAEKSIRQAQDAGLTIEKIIVLDNPTEETAQYFNAIPFDGWRIEQVDERDPGLTRNAGVNLASGTYIAFLDADDLFSPNWLTKAHQHAEELLKVKQHVVIHPELYWRFDGERGAKMNLPQDHPFLDPGLFLTINPFDALCFTTREFLQQQPFKPREIDKGYAFEDWCWIINAFISGAFHSVAKDTIIFKRRRFGSINRDARNRNSSLPLIENFSLEDIQKYRLQLRNPS